MNELLYAAAIVGGLIFLAANLIAIVFLLAKRENEDQRFRLLREKLKTNDSGSGVLWIERWIHDDE